MDSSVQIEGHMTAKELLDLEVREVPMLIKDLMQKKGLVGITGSSDTGKSCFLRQLALAITRGDSHFLNFEINARSQHVLYVSTEDLMEDLAYLIRKQLGDPEESLDCYDNLHFITDTHNLLTQLDERVEELQPDCVIIDCFTDLFTGDMNMASSMRPFLDNFRVLAQRHNTLFILLNHVGKRTETNRPSKHNSLGSQSFEAKMRLLIEFRKDQQDPTRRHLCIVKGNYIPEEHKTQSYVLRMDQETLTYHYTGERLPFAEMGTNRTTYQDQWGDRACELREANPDATIDQILELLQQEGFTGSRSTAANILNECP